MTEHDETYGCELWLGKTNQAGYPVVWRGSKPRSAHKLAYEAKLGAVPDGKVLDHLCRRRLCVAVLHLEPVTPRENELRKSWPYRCMRKLCARGHSLEDAIVTPEMGRLCRTCHVEAKR